MSSNIFQHPLYTRTTVALEKTLVRDKLLRLVQYFSRFLSFYLFRKGYSTSAVVRAKTIQSVLSNSRKLFRVGKFLAPLRAAVAELHNQTSDPAIKYTNVLKNAGTAGFLFVDFFLWLNNANIYKYAPETAAQLAKTSFTLWLIGLLAGVAQGAYLYYRADAQEKALVQEKEKDVASLKRVRAEKSKAATQVVWNGLDSLIPATGLGLLNLDDGIVGLAGTITSWFGLQAAF